MATLRPGCQPRPESLVERDRIVAAAVEVVGANGYEASTLEMVLDRADVDRETFDRHFDDLQDCCARAYAAFIDDFNLAVFGAIREAGAETWRNRLRLAAYAAARYFRDHPDEIRFSVTGILGAGEMIQVQREDHLRLMVDFVDGARQELDDPDSITRAAAESTVGSIFGFLLKEVNSRGDARSAVALVPELMYIAVRPYLGEEAAREELTMPPPTELEEGG